MEGRKIQFGRIAGAAFAMLLMSAPAFAQTEGGGGLDIVDMFYSMGPRGHRRCGHSVHHVVLVGGRGN